MDETVEQPDKTTATKRKPAPEGYMTWTEYWTGVHGQPWRKEPEIDEARQRFLNERRAITPNIEQDIYPLKGVKLNRADIEWLLATHESGGMRGPIRWQDERDKNAMERRPGLDLRGAVLTDIYLAGLPLAGLLGGLNPSTYRSGWTEEETFEHIKQAALHLEKAYLINADLRGSCLKGAYLSGAYLCGERTLLQEAEFDWAFLQGANLDDANLEGARFYESHLEYATLNRSQLQKAMLHGAHMEGARLWDALMQDADLSEAHLAGADLEQAHLEGATLTWVHLEGKRLASSDLERIQESIEDATPDLEPCILRGAFFDSETYLQEAVLGTPVFGYVKTADTHWSEANLAIVSWTEIPNKSRWRGEHPIILGDEREARAPCYNNGDEKAPDTRLYEFQAAVRAYRQLSTALRTQGLNEDADRFAYRAQMLQRQVLQRRGQWLRWLGSLLLDVIAGYGYRPLRAFGAYAFVIALFMALYLLNSHFTSPHLTWNEALVLSMSSFHGRGFFNPNIQLGDTFAQLAAVEAFVGLFIEITFIATFTQRFFAR